MIYWNLLNVSENQLFKLWFSWPINQTCSLHVQKTQDLISFDLTKTLTQQLQAKFVCLKQRIFFAKSTRKMNCCIDSISYFHATVVKHFDTRVPRLHTDSCPFFLVISPISWFWHIVIFEDLKTFSSFYNRFQYVVNLSPSPCFGCKSRQRCLVK